MRAQKLRREATPAERKLWQYLSASKLDLSASKLGWKFSRQMPVGPYICDFLCRTARLAVEIDGNSHADTVRHDEKRTRFIEELGIRIIRFSNADVIGNTEGVVFEIAAELARTPHPRPLPQAGGGQKK